MGNKKFRLCTALSKSTLIPQKLRVRLLRAAGLKLPDNVIIASGVDFKSNRVSVGEGTLINRNCSFYTSEAGKDLGKVIIGKKVHIGPDSKFVCFTHEIGSCEERAGNVKQGDILIGDGAWLGCNCTVLPGTTIGKGCVIGAGALVNKDCDDNCVYAGVPARKIRRLEDSACC